MRGVDSDDRHWQVDMREVDRAVLSYWRVRCGWTDTPISVPDLHRRWTRGAFRPPSSRAARRPA